MFTVANVVVVVPPVVPVPDTSPANVIALEIATVETAVMRPFPSTVSTGTAVDEP